MAASEQPAEILSESESKDPYTRNSKLVRMGDLGRVFVWIGGLILLIGVVMIVAGKLNLPVGRLPGDFTWRGKNTTVYFPLMTSIVLSVILSLVLYFVNRMGR